MKCGIRGKMLLHPESGFMPSRIPTIFNTISRVTKKSSAVYFVFAFFGKKGGAGTIPEPPESVAGPGRGERGP